MINTQITMVKNVLSDNGWDYSDYAVNEIVNTTIERKAEILSFFKRLEGYEVEKMRVRFDIPIEVKPDEINVRKIMRELSYPSEVIDLLERSFSTMYPLIDINNPVVTPVLNSIFTHFGYKVGVGMKLSRAFNKIVEGWKSQCLHDRVEAYEKTMIKLMEALSIRTVNETYYISCSPYDFLRMSRGNSWNSCHDIDNEDNDCGSYASGTLSLAMDEPSLLLYRESGKGDTLVARQHGILSEASLGFGRIYGGIKDSIMNECVDDYILKDIARQLNSHVGIDAKKSYSSRAYGGGTAYADWDSYYYYTGTYETAVLCNLDYYVSLSQAPLCIECGDTHDHEEKLICQDCYNENYTFCNSCGDRIDGSTIHTHDDNTICNSCYERDWFTCDDCGNVHRDRNRIGVDGDNRYICRECFEEGNYLHCENCLDLVHSDTVTFDKSDTCYCNGCYSDIYPDGEEDDEQDVEEKTESYIVDIVSQLIKDGGLL